MSYGVVASKTGHVQVEAVIPEEQRSYDRTREKYRPPVTTVWAAGRLTLTSLHLSFVPTRTSRGVPPVSIALSDILNVEATPGRVNKVVSFRTADRVVHARVTGAMAFAKQVAISAEAARKRTAGQAIRSRSTEAAG
jgi:hypothetical protein